MKNIYRKNLKYILSLTTLFLILVAVINYSIDPFQQYRESKLYRAVFVNAKNLNAGLIKNYDYNFAIVGSSMAENFLIKDVDRLFNSKALKVTLSGASAKEISTTLNLLLECKKAKTILLALDIFSFSKEDNSLPLYLYDTNYLNDFKYILNFDTLFEANLELILRNFLKYKEELTDIKRAYYWGDNYDYSKELAILDFKSESFMRELKPFKSLKESFRENLFSHIEKNPEIEFKLFFPPYSILTWKHLENFSTLNRALEFKRYLLESLISKENVELYDFQNIEEIVLNLDNYKDISHYSPAINRFILNSISNREFLVEDIDSNMKSLREITSKFSIEL